jgi:hypothetical protein
MNRYTIRMRDGSTVVIDGYGATIVDGELGIFHGYDKTRTFIAASSWTTCAVDDSLIENVRDETS